MNRIIRLLFPLLGLLPCHAQVNVAPILQPHQTFVDQSGSPCAGCSLFSYTAGTTTPRPTYTDASGAMQNTNPIILNVPGGANIWVDTSTAYKFVLKDTLGATIWTVDNVRSPAGNAIVSSPSGTQTITQIPGTDLGVNTSGGGKFKYNGLEVLTAASGCPLTGCVQLNPTITQTITQPTGTFTKQNALSADGNFVTANAGSQVLYAWGNSQTQGFGLPGCTTLTCHPDTAWPAVFTAKMGWTLNNQAYGSSDCADLTYQGTTESLWNQVITTSSRSIYAHFRNDQSQYGLLPYRVDFARGCVAAQTAWLAIPETGKKRANGGFHDRTGTWVDGTPNAVASTTMTPGATMTFFVTGKTAYLATARIFATGEATYTVSVDSVPVFDPTTQSYTFTQALDKTNDPGFPINENIVQNLIRMPGLSIETHAVTYTCVSVTTTPCTVFYAAGVSPDNSTANGPFVYSLSPVSNSDAQSFGNMAQSTTSRYYEEWKRMLSELDGDGLQVIGIDALNKNVYDANTDTQADGVHPAVGGAAKIAAGAVSKATAASTPLDRASSAMTNANEAYGGLGAGPAPSPSGSGSTNPTYLIPQGSTWSSTGGQTGQMFFGYDGTTFIRRIADDPSGANNIGVGHIYTTASLDSKNANFAVLGQATAVLTNANAGGRLRALNDTVMADLFSEGASGDGVTGWASNSILTTNRNQVINSDLGLIDFQIARVRKMALTGTDLILQVPITIGSGTVPVVFTPTVGKAACIKASGPPVQIGYCSTAPDGAGSCTCN